MISKTASRRSLGSMGNYSLGILFEIQQWDVTGRREIAPSGRFAILFCLAGDIVSAGIAIKPGEFVLIPAAMPDRYIQPRAV